MSTPDRHITFSYAGDMTYTDYDGPSPVSLYTCSECGALVLNDSQESHADWHRQQHDMASEDVRQLLDRVQNAVYNGHEESDRVAAEVAAEITARIEANDKPTRTS